MRSGAIEFAEAVTVTHGAFLYFIKKTAVSGTAFALSL
jgi:hypothetical protein